jgi:hypothetical protein
MTAWQLLLGQPIVSTMLPLNKIFASSRLSIFLFFFFLVLNFGFYFRFCFSTYELLKYSPWSEKYPALKVTLMQGKEGKNRVCHVFRKKIKRGNDNNK